MEAKQVEQELKRKKEEKQKSSEFQHNERNIEINRDNQILLNKLVEISAGKRSIIKKEKEVITATPVGITNIHKSLNVGYRKRETERIE